MEEIKKNGLTVKLKRDYLTAGQVSNLVEQAVSIYKEGGLFEDYAFNPVDMEINFYAGLFYFVVEDYDINDNNRLEELFSAGVHKELLDKIENAQLAYDLMWKTAKEIGNSVGSILNRIKNFLDNLPEQEDLEKLAQSLPEDWKNITKEYNNIMNKNINNEGDKE